MASAQGPNESFTENLFTSYCQEINKKTPSQKTVADVLIQKVDQALQQRVIGPSQANQLIPESIRSLKDRKIQDLTAEDKSLIMDVFDRLLTPPSSPEPPDEGFASGVDQKLSKSSSKEIKKESETFQQELKELFKQPFSDHIIVSKSHLPFQPYIVSMPIMLEVLTPQPSDLSLGKEVPDQFAVDQLKNQRSPYMHIKFNEPGFPLKFLNVKSADQARELINLADLLSRQLQRSNPQHAKAIKHALLFFLSQHIQNAAFGPIIGALKTGLVSSRDYELTHIETGLTSRLHRIEITVSTAPPNGFNIEIKGNIPYVHQDVPDKALATLNVEGSCTCRVSPEGTCEIENPQFKYSLKIS